MAKNGFKVLDSDIHVVEPPDLWERYLDPPFKHLAPRGTPDTIFDLLRADGAFWGRSPNLPSDANRPLVRAPGQVDPRFKSFAQRGWTGAATVEAMDVEGVDVAVAYPSRGLHALGEPGIPPDFIAAMARAYNNWLHDFCQDNPKRLLGAGMLSIYRIEDAVLEANRCVKELGFRGVFLRPNIVLGRNWHDPYYDPLWSTLEELNIPVGFHEGIFTALPEVGSQFGNNAMLRHTVCHPVEQMLAVTSLCGGSVLERHPGLRAAFLEANCSWLPALLWRLDEHWERDGKVWAPELKMPPSAYFKRQCFASVEADEVPVKYVIDWLGNGQLVFSTDFPHGDSKFPATVERFLQLPITAEDKRQILWDNCAAYYGLTERA